MDRFFSILLLVSIVICSFSLNKFILSNQTIYIFMSIFGIVLSIFMLLLSNKTYLDKLLKK